MNVKGLNQLGFKKQVNLPLWISATIVFSTKTSHSTIERLTLQFLQKFCLFQISTLYDRFYAITNRWSHGPPVQNKTNGMNTVTSYMNQIIVR